jgi:hypothetical protein
MLALRWRDTRQMNLAIAATLDGAGVPGLWDAAGPTAEGQKRLLYKGGSLPLGDRTLLLALRDLVDNKSPINGLLVHLGPDRTRLLFGLLAAAADSAQAVEAWCKSLAAPAPRPAADAHTREALISVRENLLATVEAIDERLGTEDASQGGPLAVPEKRRDR